MELVLEQNISEIHLKNTSNITQNLGLDNSTENHFYFHVKTSQIPFLITAVILFIIGVVGNSLTLISLTCFKELRTRYYALIGSLSASGLLMNLVVPLNIFFRQGCMFPQMWFISEFVKLSLYLISALHMIIIAVERFIVIKYPINHQLKFTVKQLKICVFLIWLIPILLVVICVTLVMDPLNIIEDDLLNDYNCTLKNAKQVGELCSILIAFGLGNLAICIVSTKIIKTYRKNSKQIARHVNVRNSGYFEGKQFRLSLTLAIVKVMFMVTYTPLTVVKIIQFSNLNLSAESLKLARDVADMFAYSSSAANFFIYVGRIKAFRKAYCKIIQCKCNENLR